MSDTAVAMKGSVPRPMMQPTRGNPDCSGRELRDFLESSGTPKERLNAIEQMLVKDPAMSGRAVLEQCLNNHPEFSGNRIGTLKKAGQFVYGPTFALQMAGSSVMTEQVDNLREQVGNLEAHIRGLEKDKTTTLKTNVDLRTENARLKEDLERADARAAKGMAAIEELEKLQAEFAKQGEELARCKAESSKTRK